MGRYLRAWGFTLRRPSKCALEQDPVVVQAWLDNVYPALKARAKREGALNLRGDESSIRLHKLAPRAGHMPQGQRAIARITGRRAGARARGREHWTRTQLELAIVEYVGWFNLHRLHEALGDMPSAEFEALSRPDALREISIHAQEDPTNPVSANPSPAH